MKTNLTFRFLHLSLAALLFLQAEVQAQVSVEFTPGTGNPAGNGPSVASQVITFQQNTNNPIGNNYVDLSPAVTATFAFANQQYSLANNEMTTNTGMSFGGNINSSAKNAVPTGLYSNMNSISSPSNTNFTSILNIVSGTGIDISSNKAMSILTSARPLYNAGSSTSGRYYYGDIVVTFNKYLINPVIHVVGLGGFYSSSGNTLGFSTELELANPGISLVKLSGSSELTVSSNKILNNAVNPNSTTGSGAASGSVLAIGSLHSLTFKVYLRGNGGNTNWSALDMHTGDLWMLGFSAGSASDVPLPVKMSSFTAVLNNGKADLKWSTVTEMNTSHFVVERSLDGRAFSEAGIVFAAGNSTDKMNYSFSDNLSLMNAPVVYYRLRTVDADASSDYSETRIIRLAADPKKELSILTYPNPVTTELRITVPAAWQNKPVVYELYSVGGQVQKRIQTANSSQTTTLNIASLAPGTYIVKAVCEGNVSQQKIVKQ